MLQESLQQEDDLDGSQRGEGHQQNVPGEIAVKHQPSDRILLNVMQPKHIYPIQLLPTLRSSQNIHQPLLYMPYPHPYPHARQSSTESSSCWPTCFPCNTDPAQEPRRNEGTWEIETYGKENYFKRNSRKGPKNGAKEEREGLLNEQRKPTRRRGRDRERDEGEDIPQEEGVGDSELEELELLDDEDNMSVIEVKCPERTIEGLYTGRSAHLTRLLLAPERVDAPIGHMLTQNVYLSRATQRLLREIHGDVLHQYRRVLWARIQDRRDYSAVTELIKNRWLGHHNGQKSHGGDSWSDLLARLSSFRADDQTPGLAQLLRNNFSNPTLRVLENFIDYRVLQQIHPAISKNRIEFHDNDEDSKPSSDFRGHIFSPDGITGPQEKKGFTLKILAQELVLMDHPYMSTEEQQYVELKKLFAQYTALYQNKSKTYLPYRLLALTTELKHLVSQQHEGHLSLHEEKSNLSSIFRLYNDLVETLPALCEFKVAWQKADSAVYGQWRTLQETRQQQGYSSTRVQLVARKVNSSDAPSSSGGVGHANKYHWSRLQQVLQDIPDLVNDIHLFEEKKDQLSFKANADEDKSSQASEREQNITIARLTSAPDSLHIALEQKAQNRKKAKELFADCVAFLSETEESLSFLPSVVYRLTSNGNVTPDQQVPPVEEARRSKIRRLSIHIDLKVNGRVLGSTVPQQMQWPAMKVDLSKLFEMRIFRKPSDITLDIYSTYVSKHGSFFDSFARKTLMASVGVPLSQVSNSGEGGGSSGATLPALCFSPIVGWYHFNSASLLAASKGRGINFSPDGSRLSKLSDVRIEGAILCGSEFDVGYDHHSNSVLVASNPEGVHGADLAYVSAGHAAHQRSLNRVSQGHAEFTKEKDFFELLPALDQIDVNDPRNDNVVALQQQGIVSGRLNQRDIFQLGGKHFTSLHMEGGISYGQYLRLQPSNRLKLLRLRELKPYLFTFPIPLGDDDIKKSEVMKNILAKELPGDGNRVLEASSDIDRLGLGVDIDEEEGPNTTADEGHNKKKVVSFLQRVRDSQTAISRKTRRKQIVTQSVIFEPNHGVGVLSFEEVVQKSIIPERKRALKPKEVDRTPIAAPTTACELLVQVVGARNVPLRAGGQDEGNAAEGSVGGGGNSRFGGVRGSHDTASLLEKSSKRNKQFVRSFVEVSFQDRKVSTTSMDGQSPMWKQSLSLPFHPPQGDFSHANLALIDDNVIFTLFDEHEVDDAARGGFLEGENTRRKEKTYLGSLTVPFSTILSGHKVEGTFRLNTPAFNNGYKRKAPYKPKPQLPPRTFLNMIGLGGLVKYHEKDNLTCVDDDIVSELDWFSCGPTSTYITIMATLDPLLSCSPYIDSELSRATTYPPDRPLVSYVQGWVKSLRSKGLHTKNRKFQCFGTNSDGLSVLVCRYLKAQKPPPGFATRRAVIHLVSLIPFIQDAQAFVGEFDLWCTMKQMWEIMGGDEEEHAIALYNFLYYLSVYSESSAKSQLKDNKDSGGTRPYAGYPSDSYVASEELFLVMGHAVPDGDAVYVMVRTAGRGGRGKGKGKNQQNTTDDKKARTSKDGNSPQDFILIDPCTGYVYSAADPNCPLRDIGTIATPYNVWANVQRKALPKDLSFNVMNPKLWKPLFSARFRPQINNLSSCQDDIVYHATEKVSCLEVEKIVKNNIKSNFRKWRSRRPRSVTSFHPDACDVMTDSLQEMEDWKLGGGRDNQGQGRGFVQGGGVGNVNDALAAIEGQATRRLSSVLRSHTLRGFPLNMAFTDVETIVQSVKSLCVHESNHPDAQFVLAVRAFPLVNGLISLWVYIGTLERERS